MTLMIRISPPHLAQTSGSTSKTRRRRRAQALLRAWLSDRVRPSGSSRLEGAAEGRASRPLRRLPGDTLPYQP